ncbi:uncharacterized protein LOC119596901 isoform X2 [Penaeus monodon]|uniref:uncharacterized protein LOC119596901 isoform X2 n=1 Tax=Penaeus monodon TaxID=6687 RepID=UPI0018A708DD|nr:uncharacterized protein LOC119596901 isoform X2 [Penaeus monodon]
MENKRESRCSVSESVSLTEDKPHFWVERENQEAGKGEKWGDTKEVNGEDEEDDKEERVECDLSVTQIMGSRMTAEKFMDLQKFVESQKSLDSDRSNSFDSFTVNTSRSSWNEAELTDDSTTSLLPSTDDSLENYEAHMSVDSVDEYRDMVRTLQHYRPRVSRRRRRRRRRQRLKCTRQGSSSSSSSSSSSPSTVSSDSDCSCVSCSSLMTGVTKKYFGAEVGPPGGEGTKQRRAAIWLESIKYLWGILVYGLLVLSILFLATAIWMTQRVKEREFGHKMLYWGIPFVVVMLLVVLVWQGTWHTLLRLGYGDIRPDEPRPDSQRLEGLLLLDAEAPFLLGGGLRERVRLRPLLRLRSRLRRAVPAQYHALAGDRGPGEEGEKEHLHEEGLAEGRPRDLVGGLESTP